MKSKYNQNITTHTKQHLHIEMIWILASILILCFSNAFAQNPLSSSPIDLGDIVINDSFEPGTDMPIATVMTVEEDVIVIHDKSKNAYRLKNFLPLFQEDTIITREKGRIRFKLNDESILTLGSNTKFVLNRTVFDPDKKERSSFLNMGVGKARLLIKKLPDFKRSEVKIKTETAVVGVRGSDIIIFATPDITHVSALDNTQLEVIPLPCQGCEIRGVHLNNFQMAIVQKNMQVPEVHSINQSEIQQLKDPVTIRETFQTMAPIKPIEVEHKFLIQPSALINPKEISSAQIQNMVQRPEIEQYKKETAADPIKEISQKEIVNEIRELKPLQFPAIPRDK